MEPEVKFCGFTKVEDVQCAVQLGAAFVGFVFVGKSPRSVSLEEAKVLRQRVGAAAAVGVFEGTSAREIRRIALECDFDYVQIYDDFESNILESIGIPVIRAFRGVPPRRVLKEALRTCPYVLIDKESGSARAPFDAIAALPASIRDKLFLSGGLTTQTVSTLVREIRPFAVDIARGIERFPGKKDQALMTSFVNAARI